MNKFLGWRTPTNIAECYVNSVAEMLSSEENFNQFRGVNKNYGRILEHLTQNDGQIYGDYIIKNYWEILQYLSFFKENDIIGNPILFDYNVFGKINPTTLRYIKFVGDIKKIFGNLNGLDLIEIGGGYGGLIKILTTIYDFNSIKLFDLPNPLQLQKKYLGKFNINVETYTYEDDFNINKNSIIISNYAWCECDRVTRDLYLEKIINKVKYTYMVVYGVDVDEELMSLDGEKTLTKDVLNACQVFSLKK